MLLGWGHSVDFPASFVWFCVLFCFCLPGGVGLVNLFGGFLLPGYWLVG